MKRDDVQKENKANYIYILKLENRMKIFSNYSFCFAPVSPHILIATSRPLIVLYVPNISKHFPSNLNPFPYSILMPQIPRYFPKPARMPQRKVPRL